MILFFAILTILIVVCRHYNIFESFHHTTESGKMLESMYNERCDCKDGMCTCNIKSKKCKCDNGVCTCEYN